MSLLNRFQVVTQRSKSKLKSSKSSSASWTMAHSSDLREYSSKFSNKTFKWVNVAFQISVMKAHRTGHKIWLHHWTISATQAPIPIGKTTSWLIVARFETTQQYRSATRQWSSSTTNYWRTRTKYCCTTRSVKQNYVKSRKERSWQQRGRDKLIKGMEKPWSQSNNQMTRAKRTAWREMISLIALPSSMK